MKAQIFTTSSLLSALLLFVLVACTGHNVADRFLDTADSLSNVQPDSALHLLDSLSDSKTLTTDHRPQTIDSCQQPTANSQRPTASLNCSQRMRLELLRARCMNKAYIPVGVDGQTPSDSILLDVVKYYDRHGTPNEQMEAHYLLGCAYRDMGEAPHAVDCYLDAIAKADTTANDCDFNIISCIYSQMAYLYHTQLLLSYEIEAHKEAIRFDYIVKDTLGAIYEKKMIAGAYILANKTDSAEHILNEVTRLYLESENEQSAIQSSTMLMHLYINNPLRQKELKRLIDTYEEKCSLFDDRHELPPSKRLFYYYKGKYYEDVGLLDSAEFCYRKLYRTKMTFVSNDPMYGGLLSVFKKSHQTDSIVKYAQLYCEVNDSSIILKDQAMMAQLTASYNYGRFQKEAKKNEAIAHRTEMKLFVLALSMFILLAVSVYFANVYRKRQLIKRRMLEEEHSRRELQLREAHNRELARHENLLQQKEGEMLRLREIYHKVTMTIQQELYAAKSENQSMREDYFKAKHTIEEINMNYEQDKAALTEEIVKLSGKIAILKSQEVFADNQEKARLFHETEIVKELSVMSENPMAKMTENDTENLEKSFVRFFPLFLQDIKAAKGTNRTDIVVAMLSALGFKPAHIQRLIGKTPSQITNSKAKINKLLFGDNSASTLNKNIVTRYGI